MSMLRRVVPALVCLLALLAGCSGGGGPTDPLPSGQAALVASKLGVLAVAVATGPQGRGFFDNFLPCARRGVVDYRNTSTGRRATFSGCDLGDGVVVDGGVELRWSGARVSRIEWEGAVDVAIGGAAPVRVERMTVEGIAFRDPVRPSVDGVELESLRVTLAGTTSGVDERGSPARLFGGEGMSIDALPNPANSLAALTGADLKRIAYHASTALASVLLDETLEIQRGEHTHQTACGTLRVTPDAARGTTHLEYAWTACPVGGGLFVEGTFAQDWRELDPRGGRLGVTVQGKLTLGGGVPRTTLDRLEWTVSGVASLPADARIAGRLAAGGQERSFAFDLVLDD